MSQRIDVHHVTRVEGHGNIVVEVADGVVKECRFDVVETPRFFEAMLLRTTLYSRLRTSPAASAASAPSGTLPLRCERARMPSAWS